MDVVPLLGAIAGCHCSVLLPQLWGSGRGAIAGCHVVCYGLGVTTNFGGVDGGRCWVPLQVAIVVCYGGGTQIFFTLITQKVFFAIWGLCWYNFCVNSNVNWTTCLQMCRSEAKARNLESRQGKL